MSIHSKAKRDARKKKQSKSAAIKHPASSIRPHAHLLDGDSNVIGGAGLRGTEWVIVVGGQVMAGTDSAGMALAMLKHVATLREAAGHAVQLNYSTYLRDAAAQEAQAKGMTLDAHLEALEQERIERLEDRQRGLLVSEAEATAAPDTPK